MLLARHMGLVRRCLQEIQLDLQRCVSQETSKLRLSRDLGRHQIEKNNMKRTNILRHRAGIRHDKYVFPRQRFYSW